MRPSIWSEQLDACDEAANIPTDLTTQVAIIGGGSAGACCALALRQCGVKQVTIIEASGFDQFRIGESIPPESKQLMLKFGIWQAFLAEQHLPCYGSRSWWGDESRGYNDSLLNPLGHGWHLDRAKFNLFLAEQARNAQVTLLLRYHFCTTSALPNGGYRLKLRHKNRICYIDADFVVDASGARCHFAKSQGSRKQFSSPLICSSCLYQITDDNHPLTGLTHLEAVASGWWYSARLPNDKLLISHMTDSDTFRRLRLKNIEHWNNELLQSANTQLLVDGTKPFELKPRIYNAPSFVLDKVVGEDWLAIGDAASSYDPITSQGIFKSMNDGMSVAPRIASYLQEKDFGLFEEYQSIVTEHHQQYRQMRDYFYMQEGRFKKQSFWRKMHHLHESAQEKKCANWPGDRVAAIGVVE